MESAPEREDELWHDKRVAALDKTPTRRANTRRGTRLNGVRMNRRGSRAVVRWSWLHATAYSSAIVASVAYMHNELTVYFQSLDRRQVNDELLYSLAAVASVGNERLEGLHHGLSQLASQLRWLMVMLSLAVWFGGLVLSRRYHLHSPLRRVTKRVTSCINKLRSGRSSSKTSRHRSKRQKLSGQGSWSAKDFADQEIDETDLLIVSSLSPEWRLQSNGAGQSPQDKRREDQDKHEASGRSRRSSSSSSDLGGKIVLHPREGACGGRHESNQIISDDPFVSRFHFQIQYDPLEKEYFLQDLGSTMGTFVFLKPDAPKRLHVGDRVKLGETEFEVVAIDESLTTGAPFMRICFTDGPLAGIAQTIGKTSVTLGRHSSNALCITDDDSISGRHSVLSFFGNGFYITDLQSTNGTAVRLSASGKKSRRRFLLHGDVFGVGSNRFRVEYSLQLAAQRKLARSMRQQRRQQGQEQQAQEENEEAGAAGDEAPGRRGVS